MYSQLDEVMCGPYGGRGFLCGECEDDYGLAVFFHYCKLFTSLGSGYTIFFNFFRFVPTTFIIICLVLFCFGITSGPLLNGLTLLQVY